MTTTVRVRKSDGTVFEVMPDGTERLVTPLAPRDMTDDEVIAAALADPDAQPMTPEQSARLRPVAKSKRIRWTLGISREEFAARFHIPLDLVIAWERYQAEPDAVAIAYLHVIAADPEAAERALAVAPVTKAAE